MKKVHAVLGAIACAVGASASAQSSVTISGLVDLGLQTGKGVGDTSHTTLMEPGGMTTSYLQFAGKEDLGGGMAASFTLGTFFRGGTGDDGRFFGDTLFSRDANVGLAGDFGKVLVGRQIDPAFLPTILFNPFVDSFDYSPLVFHTYLTPNPNPNPTNTSPANNYTAPLFSSDSGYNNAVSYTTPQFGGTSATFEYQLGGIAGKSSKANYGANILSFAGPLALTAFFESNELTNPGTSTLYPVTTIFAGNNPYAFQGYSKAKLYGIGAKYDFTVVKLFANVDEAKYTAGAVGEVTGNDKNFDIGASVPIGAGALLIEADRTKLSSGWAAPISSAKWTSYAVGYDYSLSKRTDVYLNDKADKFSGATSGNVFGFGIRHKF
jgi:predicted porin